MYKHMKTLLLSVVMLFSVCMQGVTVYAAGPTMTFTFERDKETAEVGDTINYKVYIDEATNIVNYALTLSVPEGLTLDTACADIWKTVTGFTNTVNPNQPCIFAQSTDPGDGASVTAQTLLMEFSCTVTGDASVDASAVQFIDVGIFDKDWAEVSPVVNHVVKVVQTVSGAVTSYINDTDAVTVELYQAGEETAAFTTTVTGMSATYTIEEVPVGEYTMKVAKANHVTREYSVTVAEEAVVQDVVINPVGDITLDGKLDGRDASAASRYLAKIMTLEGYALQCADATLDGKVDGRDASALSRHIAKITPLW